MHWQRAFLRYYKLSSMLEERRRYIESVGEGEARLFTPNLVMIIHSFNCIWLSALSA